jgi:HSP20 family protein
MSYGSFVRSIKLPSSVNVDKISASCDDGILEIALPKTGIVEPKKVPTTAKKTEKLEPKAKVVESKPKAARPKAKKETQAK